VANALRDWPKLGDAVALMPQCCGLIVTRWTQIVSRRTWRTAVYAPVSGKLRHL